LKNWKQILDIAASCGILEVKTLGPMSEGDVDDASDVDLHVSLPEVAVFGGLLMDVQDHLGEESMCLQKATCIRRFVIRLLKKRWNCEKC